MYQGPQPLDNQEQHERGDGTDTPPPISTEYSPSSRSTKAQCAVQPEHLPDESDCSSTRAWYGDPEDRSHGYDSPSDYTPRFSLTAGIIRDHFNSGRISYYSQQGHSVPLHLHEKPYDTLAQVGTRSISQFRHHIQAPPPSTRIRSRIFFQLSDVMTAHSRVSSEHVGLHMAAETGQQPLKTNEPAGTRNHKKVHFSPLTVEYGGDSGPEYGSLSPPAPSKLCTLPVESMLDKHGDLLHCYQ